MSQRGRGIVLGLVGTAAVLLAIALMLLGNHNSELAVRQVRSHMATGRVDIANILSTMADAQPNPVAVALHIPSSEVVRTVLSKPDWCATVRVTRMMSTRSISISVRPNGQTTEVSGCPAS